MSAVHTVPVTPPSPLRVVRPEDRRPSGAETSAGTPDPDLSLRFYDVISADGTRLRAWTNDADGPTVLLCNGLGTNPYAWPALLRRDCGVRVISWNHRGVGGSARPHDPELVGIEQFVEDAVAVLDDAGLDRVPVMGWSMGVNTMFELAVLHPDRVAGLFAVGGVPGDTFTSMGAPLLLPRPIRKPLTVAAAAFLARTGGVLTPLTTRLPVTPRTARLVTHSGFMLPRADPTVAARAIAEFLTTPVDWYMHLAVATSRHLRVSLRDIAVPTSFVAGRWDLLASSADMRTAAERIPDATYVELPCSHFLSLEEPEEVHRLLLDLLARV